VPRIDGEQAAPAQKGATHASHGQPRVGVPRVDGEQAAPAQKEKSMSFDADMRKVTERYKTWANTAIITNDDFGAVDSLIQRHYDDRGRLFDELQNALKRDHDIQSPWDNLCDKGVELTDRLNNEIARKIPDGFKGLGMTDFYEGEKKAWQNCKSGRIGLIAETFSDIGQNNVEIYKQLEEDFKKAREDSQVIDEVCRATFSEFRDQARGVVGEVGGILVALPVAALPMIGKNLAPKVKQFVQSLIKGSSTVRELTKKKRAAREIISRNAELLVKAKDQIGDSAIRDILKRAEDIAGSWKDAASSDYKQDWEYVGKACIEILHDKAAPVTEKAKMLFDNMQPMYIEALRTSLITLYTDPSTLENFKGQLNDDMQKMLEDLAKENLVIATLRDSEPKRSADEQMKQIVQEINEALADLKTAIREIDEQMKV